MDESPVDPAWLKLLPLPMGVVRAGLITFANQAFIQVSGFSEEELTEMARRGEIAPQAVRYTAEQATP